VFWTYAAWNIGYHAVFSIAIPTLLTELAGQPHVKLTAQPEDHVRGPGRLNRTDRQACQLGELPGC
jgi:hypothetical protein